MLANAPNLLAGEQGNAKWQNVILGFNNYFNAGTATPGDVNTQILSIALKQAKDEALAKGLTSDDIAKKITDA